MKLFTSDAMRGQLTLGERRGPLWTGRQVTEQPKWDVSGLCEGARASGANTQTTANTTETVLREETKRPSCWESETNTHLQAGCSGSRRKEITGLYESSSFMNHEVSCSTKINPETFSGTCLTDSRLYRQVSAQM